MRGSRLQALSTWLVSRLRSDVGRHLLSTDSAALHRSPGSPRAARSLRHPTAVATLVLAFAATLLSGCASGGGQANALQSAQYAWSAAIRWGDFEGALNLVDPKHREAHPVTDLELQRYEQIRISSYRELGARAGASEALREIQIGVINRHNMAERTVRYTERWRYDPEAKAWWIVDGLPDLWAGE